MDKAKVLAKCPPHTHACCEAMAAAGVDWATILTFVLDVLISFLNRPKSAAAPAAAACPDDVKTQATCMREKAAALYLEALDHERCCGCCPHDE